MSKKRTANAAKAARSSRTPKAAKRPMKKTNVKRAPAKKKAAAKKRAVPGPSATGKKALAAQAAAKRKRPAAKRPSALGRPKVPGTAELDQLFLKDYEARQVFTFLGVKTIKELEEHPPEEIVNRLTGPMVQTVERIRKALAINNRFLSGDQKYAVAFCRQIR